MWKIEPVLATGCCLVLKPADEASLTALRLSELCSEAGAPDGVINVVPGFGEIAGATLAAHRGVKDRFYRITRHRPGDRAGVGRKSQARDARTRPQVAEHRLADADMRPVDCRRDLTL